MQANGGHPVITAYLVSIFGMADQARAAYHQQVAGYEAMVHASTAAVISVPAPSGLGDRDAYYAGSSSTDSGIFDLGELFFTRGRVLVQVVQGFYADDLDPYGDAAIPYQKSLAATLDGKASRSEGG